jgi:hypothetical protein
MVTHSKIVDPLYILHENMQFLSAGLRHWNDNFAAVMTEILAVCF